MTLQRSAGNAAVSQLIGTNRDLGGGGLAPVGLVGQRPAAPALERARRNRTGPAGATSLAIQRCPLQWAKAGSSKEIKIVIKKGQIAGMNVGATFRVTFKILGQTGAVLTDKGEHIKAQLLTAKGSLDRKAGKWARSMAIGLFKVGWESPKLGPFALTWEVKGLEGKLSSVTDEQELALISMGVAGTGSVPEFLTMLGTPDLKNVVHVKVSLKGDVGVGLADVARIRALWKARAETDTILEQIAKESDQIKKDAERAARRQQQLARAKDSVASAERDVARLNRGLNSEIRKQRVSRRSSRNIRARRRRQIRSFERQIVVAEGKAAKARKGVRAAQELLVLEEAKIQGAHKRVLALCERLGGPFNRADNAIKGLKNTRLAQATNRVYRRALETAAKRLARSVLLKLSLKLIPILGWVSLGKDLYDVGIGIYHLLSGRAKLGLNDSDSSGGEAGGEPADDVGSADGSRDTSGADTGETGGPDSDSSDSSIGSDQDDGSDEARESGSGGSGKQGGDPDSTSNREAGTTGRGDADAGGTAQLDPEVRTLLETLAGGSVVLSDDQIQAFNDQLPRGLTAKQIEQIRQHLDAKISTEIGDPYELIGLIHEAILEARDAPTNVEIDGKRVKVDSSPEADEPPKLLNPVPKHEMAQMIRFRRGEAQISQSHRKQVMAGPHVLPGGLVVVVRGMWMSNKPEHSGAKIVIAHTLIRVKRIPASAGADYPWKKGEKKTEIYKFVHRTKSNELLHLSTTGHPFSPGVVFDGTAWKPSGTRIPHPDGGTLLVTSVEEAKQRGDRWKLRVTVVLEGAGNPVSYAFNERVYNLAPGQPTTIPVTAPAP